MKVIYLQYGFVLFFKIDFQSPYIGISLAQQMIHRALLLVCIIVSPREIETGYII